jgi:hypothetical protein
MPIEKANKLLSKRATADIHKDFLQPSGSTVFRQVVSMNPCLQGSGSTLLTLEALTAVLRDHRKASKIY